MWVPPITRSLENRKDGLGTCHVTAQMPRACELTTGETPHGTSMIEKAAALASTLIRPLLTQGAPSPASGRRDAHDHFPYSRRTTMRAYQMQLALPFGGLYSALPIATAVSAMRFEKPHSLSYQDSTRTKVPSITLVWSMWNVAECGSWLKSIETLGAVV